MYTVYSLGHFRMLMKSISFGSHWFHLFNRYIINTSYVLGTIVGTGHTGVNRTRIPTFKEIIL